MTMRFKSIFLDPYNSQPTYNDKNEVLCEVLVDDGSTALAFVPAETIRSIGIILPKRINPNSLESNNSQDLQDRSNKSPSPEIIEIVEPFSMDNSPDFVWSPYRSTPEDHKATKRFIEIISTEPYAEKLKDKTTPKYKVWQQISNEMKKSGFPVAENEKEGGKKCDQKWRNLENKYALYNANAKKNGQPARKKPPYYDMINAIKNKKPLAVAEEKGNKTSRINHENCETIVVLPSETSNNIDCQPTTTTYSKEQILSPSEILQRITVHHEEILEMQKRHFEEMKANMKKQNDQRQEMLNMFASLVENTKRKRKRSESD